MYRLPLWNCLALMAISAVCSSAITYQLTKEPRYRYEKVNRFNGVQQIWQIETATGTATLVDPGEAGQTVAAARVR